MPVSLKCLIQKATEQQLFSFEEIHIDFKYSIGFEIIRIVSLIQESGIRCAIMLEIKRAIPK